MAGTTNTFGSLKPIYKETYAEGKKKNSKKKKQSRFEKLLSKMKKKRNS